jgi:hypothetical protein
MRVALIRNCGFLIALATASLSCRGAAPLASPTSAVTPPPPAQSQLMVSTKCAGPFRAGDYVPLACFVFVDDGARPGSNSFSVRVDYRVFGGPADVVVPACPACGGPPWTFDLDVIIRPDVTPGVKTFPVWATDAAGHRADTTATLEIVAR